MIIAESIPYQCPRNGLSQVIATFHCSSLGETSILEPLPNIRKETLKLSEFTTSFHKNSGILLNIFQSFNYGDQYPDYENIR